MASEQDKVQVATRLEVEIRDLAVQVARAKGIDFSEYLRALIISDLDNRHLLDARLRQPNGTHPP